MEKWKKVFEKQLPKAQYQVQLQNGEEKGLVINLVSKESRFELDFGSVSAVRMLEEGVALDNLFHGAEFEDLKNTGFSNVIYQLDGGEFGAFIQKTSKGLYEYLELKHYVIVTMNYIIEIITQWEPEIKKRV